MFPENYFIYLQLILFYFITPGPPRVVIVSNTINHGLKKSVWTAIGDITANFVQASLVTFVVGSVLIENPKIFIYLKWAGIFYLLYLAYETFVQKIRNVENALGSNHKKITNSERLNIKYVRKSIVAKKNIFKGEIFSEKNLDVKRPGTGLSPMLWNKIIGQKAKKNFLKNQLIKL